MLNCGVIIRGGLGSIKSQRLGEKLSEVNEGPELIRRIWFAVYSRAPRADEIASATKFLATQTAELGSPKRAASELVRALFNTNEFLYVD